MSLGRHIFTLFTPRIFEIDIFSLHFKRVQYLLGKCHLGEGFSDYLEVTGIFTSTVAVDIFSHGNAVRLFENQKW